LKPIPSGALFVAARIDIFFSLTMSLATGSRTAASGLDTQPAREEVSRSNMSHRGFGDDGFIKNRSF
jgi:hypothetical protein